MMEERKRRAGLSFAIASLPSARGGAFVGKAELSLDRLVVLRLDAGCIQPPPVHVLMRLDQLDLFLRKKRFQLSIGVWSGHAALERREEIVQMYRQKRLGLQHRDEQLGHGDAAGTDPQVNVIKTGVTHRSFQI